MSPSVADLFYLRSKSPHRQRMPGRLNDTHGFNKLLKAVQHGSPLEEAFLTTYEVDIDNLGLLFIDNLLILPQPK